MLRCLAVTSGESRCSHLSKTAKLDAVQAFDKTVARRKNSLRNDISDVLTVPARPTLWLLHVLRRRLPPCEFRRRPIHRPVECQGCPEQSQRRNILISPRGNFHRSIARRVIVSKREVLVLMQPGRRSELSDNLVIFHSTTAGFDTIARPSLRRIHSVSEL
jgi:hypothetical protein